MSRTAEIHRKTAETSIKLTLDLDGTGAFTGQTGVGFFDHMLELFARHGMLDLSVEAEGDLHVDAHHTVEDVGLAFGQALLSALGDKAGIRRYGWARVPMDEALADVALDLSGRPAHVLGVEFAGPMLGTMQTELVEEFFKSLVNAGRLNLHQHVPYGRNDHHKCEAMFKATAQALRLAVESDPRAAGRVPSTKGTLTD
jgi:imidazoleglycerol-phosphate dehydratase